MGTDEMSETTEVPTGYERSGGIPLGPADSSPAASGTPVTFRTAVDARSVHLVGEFNDWSHTATPMERSGDGFETTVQLKVGREYRYRFLVDGDRWENDPAADGLVDNPYGEQDSVRTVDAAGER